METDESTIDIKTESPPVNGEIPADAQPPLNSVEDTFRTLGVWEKAVTLHKRGLTWSQVASELVSARKK